MSLIVQSGTFSIGGHQVHRLGYGAMQLAGPGVFGPPKDRDAARMRMDKAPDVCAALDAAASELEKTLARSAYRWVNMRTLFGAAGMA